jgi:predicted negative regulator of RcsB-dependent stress response
VVAYNTDEEQLEALKNWWNENGTQLLVGIAVALAAVFGFQTWQSSVQAEGEAASALYEDLRAALSAGSGSSEIQISTARFLADKLVEDYESSVYAQFALLQMAKLSVEHGKLDQAEKDLQWVMDHAEDVIQPLARLRLARVMFTRGDTEGALALIENADEGAYKTSYWEARGDFYSQMGRSADARNAYQTALNEMQQVGSNPVLQMKLDDVPMSDGAGSSMLEQQEPAGSDSKPESEPSLKPAPDAEAEPVSDAEAEPVSEQVTEPVEDQPED